MKILVIGSGGREHAIVWKLAQSPKTSKIFCAPGNAGIAQIAECVRINADDIPSLKDFAQKNSIDLTVVGPETPLVAGIVDAFEAAGLKIFGPSKTAAQLEGSKVFSKNLMMKCNIPTAEAVTYTNAIAAFSFIRNIGAPVVVKADGLCGGKGVIVAKTIKEAEAAITRILVSMEFGDAGDKVMIEECLTGEEVSILAFTDGKNIVPLAASQDHKRLLDNDKGENTGGMGAYSPAPIISHEDYNVIEEKILKPTIKAMEEMGAPYKGVLYCGLMLTNNGPYVLEYNCRFGDPETQVILPRMKSDLLEIMLAVVDSKLDQIPKIEWDDRTAVCVVMASGGYPRTSKKGFDITGMEEASKLEDTIVFHAGTASFGGKHLTSGGRVLGVTALGHSLKDAISKSYKAVNLIKFENMHFRKDIGVKGLKHKKYNFFISPVVSKK